jgi:deazaflavin-dependent oxidoreductase (nitroreductase family)
MTGRLHRLDVWVQRWSRQRWTATQLLTGLPVIFMTSLGAKSGLEHTTPLLALSKDGRFIIIGTNFGAERHPDWVVNLRAHPIVAISYQGHSGSYRVSELEGEDRAAAWAYAVAHYPGYKAYEQRAAQRKIPVLALDPIAPQ